MTPREELSLVGSLIIVEWHYPPSREHPDGRTAKTSWVSTNPPRYHRERWAREGVDKPNPSKTWTRKTAHELWCEVPRPGEVVL